MKAIKVVSWSVGILIAGYFILAMVITPSPVVGDYFNRKEFNSERWKSWEESEAEPSLRWGMLYGDYRQVILNCYKLPDSG